MKKRRMIFIFILLLVIGFASVSTTLYLNGTITIGPNEDDYDVIFIEALVDGLESNATISEDKKTITFTSNKLTKLNSTSVLDYKVKNNSTQYGASVTINCTSEETEYIKVTNVFDGNDVPLDNPVEIEAQEIKKGKITAELIKSYTGEDASIEIMCEIVAVATEKENVADYETYQYTEELLNGTDPVLEDGLIPVTIADDGTVTYADTSKQWYSYGNKLWANAVILNDGEIYNVGEVIPEDAIESYFVWIPKYKYKLWNYWNTTQYSLGSYSYNDPEVTSLTSNSIAQTISIIFTTENTTDVEGESCATPMTSVGKLNCNDGEWMTHPAFISLDVNGFWVGKFETGYKGATSATEAQVNESDASKIIIKPNVYSWRENSVYNMFISAYNYNQNLGSHMTKNTEWGAVAYLSHSVYGLNSEVNINNNSSYKTGYSALLSLEQISIPGTYGDGDEYNQPYNTEVGYRASTTGNITGVYDMSGGAHEYMAAYIDQNVSDSGFTLEEIQKDEYTKYLDVYRSDSKNYLYRILGDATGELSPLLYYMDKDGKKRYHNNWYNDQFSFITSSYPWFTRGGTYNYGELGGQFSFSSSTGEGWYTISSRLTLAF